MELSRADDSFVRDCAKSDTLCSSKFITFMTPHYTTPLFKGFIDYVESKFDTKLSGPLFNNLRLHLTLIKQPCNFYDSNNLTKTIKSTANAQLNDSLIENAILKINYANKSRRFASKLNKSPNKKFIGPLEL